MIKTLFQVATKYSGVEPPILKQITLENKWEEKWFHAKPHRSKTKRAIGRRNGFAQSRKGAKSKGLKSLAMRYARTS